MRQQQRDSFPALDDLSRIAFDPEQEHVSFDDREIEFIEDINLRDETAGKRRDCGIGICRPNCMQSLASIKAFIFVMCLLTTCSSALTSGYLSAVLTTIEKRFELGSSTSGIIVASFEFGSLVAVIFVSYLGGARHIPVWIGCGVIVMSLGSLTFILPQFISAHYHVDAGIHENVTEFNICGSQHKNKADILRCLDERSGMGFYVFIMICAQILLGTGGTPIFTLGTTYVDNHLSQEKAPAYIAFMYATAALGPVLGFGMGAVFLQFYVDFLTKEQAQWIALDRTSPNFLGAWWGGYLVIGFLLLAVAVPFFAFPRRLQRAELRKAQEDEQSALSKIPGSEPPLPLDGGEDAAHQAAYGKSIKDIPRSMMRLLSNSIFLLTCLGVCCEISIVSGFVTFLPKYLEHQFSLEKSVASLLTGGIAIPGACIGILTGGFVLKRFRLRPRGALQFTILLNFLAIVGFICVMFLGCPNPRIAGVSLPYLNRTGHEVRIANLTAACNIECDCSSNDPEMVCGVNGITYFSPCHAGCTDGYGNFLTFTGNKTFTGCKCIFESLAPQISQPAVAQNGVCKNTCYSIVPFMLVLFVTTMTVSCTQMPLLMVTMRSVGEEERSFALGMQFVILRLLGYIPAPIFFGRIIDGTCLHWRKSCEEQGFCLIYDIEHFRMRYVGTALGLKLISQLFYIFVLWLVRLSIKADLNRTLPVAEIMTSLGSIQLGPAQRFRSVPAGVGGGVLHRPSSWSHLALGREASGETGMVRSGSQSAREPRSQRYHKRSQSHDCRNMVLTATGASPTDETNDARDDTGETDVAVRQS